MYKLYDKKIMNFVQDILCSTEVCIFFNGNLTNGGRLNCLLHQCIMSTKMVMTLCYALCSSFQHLDSCHLTTILHAVSPAN
jgi:hypothetical protein